MSREEKFDALVSSLAHGDEPNAVAGERGELLAQVEHQPTKAVYLSYQHTIKLAARGGDHQPIERRARSLGAGETGADIIGGRFLTAGRRTPGVREAEAQFWSVVETRA